MDDTGSDADILQKNLKRVIDNRRFIQYIIIVLVVLMSVMHFTDISTFCYQYNYNFDMGSAFKKLCAKEYFEAETQRFKVADAKDKIAINRQAEQKYVGIAMSVTIVITFALCVIFAIMIYNIFVGKMGSFWNADGTKWYHKMGISLYIGFFILFCLFVALWVFIYIGLLLGPVGRDISPFNTNQNVYGAYAGILPYIVLVRILYWVSGGLPENVQRWVIPFWLRGNSENLLTSNTLWGLIIFFAFVALLLCVIYILGSLVRIYKNAWWDTKGEDDLYVKMFDNFDRKVSGVREDVISKFFANIWGFNEIQNFEANSETYKYLFIKKISGIFGTILIISIVMTAVYLTLHFKLKAEKADLTFFKYVILLSLIILLVVLFICSIITEYDNLLNKYILSDPIVYYKQKVSEANDVFNKIVDSEYISMKASKPGYICRNYGNAILSTLFSSVFDGVNRKSRDDVENDTVNVINITPEFIYKDDKCDTTKPYRFDDKKTNKEYDIEYYLNGKKYNKSIFYKYNKCTDVNVGVIEQVTSNLLRNVTYDPTWTDDQKQAAIKTVTDGIKQDILNSIKNVQTGKVYNSNMKDIEYTKKEPNDKEKSGVELMSGYEINNNIKYVPGVALTPTDDVYTKYADFVADKIVSEYDKMLKSFFTIYKNVYNNDKNLATNNMKDKSKGTAYATGLTRIIKAMFDSVNKNMSESTYQLNNATITPYIISNFNNINEASYEKKFFDRCDKDNKKLDTDDAALNAFSGWLSDFSKQYKNTKDLYQRLLNNDVKIDEDKAAVTIKLGELLTKLTGMNKDTINKIIQKDSSFQFVQFDSNGNASIYNSSTIPKTDVDKDEKKTVYNITYNTFKGVQQLLGDIDAYKTSLSTSDVPGTLQKRANINDKINKIDSNVNKLESNIRAAQNKYNSLEAAASDCSVSDPKKVAKNIIDNAHQANTSIYLLVFLYLVALLSTNLIVILD
jgi:hypothetical protein